MRERSEREGCASTRVPFAISRFFAIFSRFFALFAIFYFFLFFAIFAFFPDFFAIFRDFSLALALREKYRCARAKIA